MKVIRCNVHVSSLFLWMVVSLSCQANSVSEVDEDDSFSNILPLIKQSPVVEGRFVQKQKLVDFDSPIVSKGVFLYVKKKGILWHVKEPVDFVTVFYSDENEQFASQNTQNQSKMVGRIGQIIVGFMSGDFHQLSKNFLVEHRSDQGAWSLELVPKRKSVRRHLSVINLSGDQSINLISLNTNSTREVEIQFHDVVHQESLSRDYCEVISGKFEMSDLCTLPEIQEN